MNFSPSDIISIRHFPQAIGDWTSRDIKITEEEFELLETHNAISREYFGPAGERLFLFIIYSQTNRKVFHPPEICYTGGGATIVSHSLVPFSVSRAGLITANRFLIDLNQGQQVMYYWFKVGPRFTSNYWFQQFLVACQVLSGGRDGSAMIRIAVPVGEKGLPGAETTAQNFISEIYPSMLEYLP